MTIISFSKFSLSLPIRIQYFNQMNAFTLFPGGKHIGGCTGMPFENSSFFNNKYVTLMCDPFTNWGIHDGV